MPKYPDLTYAVRKPYPHLVYHPTANPVEVPSILVWDIWEWHTPASDYAEQELGNFRIHHIRQGSGYYKMWGVDGYVYYRVRRRSIPLTRLEEKYRGRWRPWMVDDPPQWRVMQIYAEKSHGQVLTAGLGLGLVHHELAKNPLVTRIVAVEISPDVVALVKKYLPPKVEIVVSDFYHFIETDKTPWDTIIVDLWVSGSVEEKMAIYYGEVLPLAAQLRLKYPKATLIFHGFITVSDVKVVQDSVIEMIQEIKPYTQSPLGSEGGIWLVYVTPDGKWGAWNISPHEPILTIHREHPKEYLRDWAETVYLDAENQVRIGRFKKYWISEAPTRYKAIKNIQAMSLPPGR